MNPKNGIFLFVTIFPVCHNDDDGKLEAFIKLLSGLIKDLEIYVLQHFMQLTSFGEFSKTFLDIFVLLL